jgi:signal transduction histidine kinase/ActR/RegA family two-component response regulator
VRQRARQIAALLEFDAHDQTRISTAVSEIARNAFLYAQGGRAQFSIEGHAPEHLIIRISDRGQGIPNLAAILAGTHKSETGMGLGLLGARKLVDTFRVDTVPSHGTTVELGKALPPQAPKATPQLILHISAELAKLAPTSLMEEIRQQNIELLHALDALQSRQLELDRMYREVADANTQLEDKADALERTAASERTAREEAAQARSELEQLMAQLREANERLVVTTVHAHTMTEDAEQANELKDEFLATVSHELRTPLNAVLGWARMLASKQLQPDRAEHGIATIERNASALAHLIDDLLDVSRIVAGTLRLAREPVDLVAVAQAALDAIRPLAVTKHVHLAFSPDPAIETVRGDAGRLEQVIWNLLANAIKFTPEGGRVDVFMAPSNDHLEVRVVDTGQGISPDFLPHVFDRFRQADGATTRRHTGLGLGLAIVRQLVELHGGTVHAVSEGVGRGATFTVALPISAGEAQAGQPATLGERRTAGSTASPMPRLPRLDGLRILVVDDNADGRTLTSLVLAQAGASVKTAASVRDALQMLEVERPDALVTDIGLPDEDGYALIRQIRQQETEHGGFLPAVALTGYARAEDRARILAAGFQAHVPKPVDPVELTAAIATVTHRMPDSEP